MQDYFLIAQILRPHGIKGELKIKSFSEDLDNLFAVKNLYIKNNEGYSPIEVDGFHLHSGEVLLQLHNVYDRNTAETYRNLELYIARADASPLEEGEFYINDILGFALVDSQGNALGTLQEVLTAYATNVYQATSPRGTLLFPAVEGVVERVDFENSCLILNEERLAEVATYEN